MKISWGRRIILSILITLFLFSFFVIQACSPPCYRKFKCVNCKLDKLEAKIDSLNMKLDSTDESEEQ